MGEHFVPFAILGVRFVGMWFGVDSNVIHIYRKPPLGHLPSEYCVHHHLEGGWQIGEAEEHNHGLEESFWGKEGGFPFISVFDTDVVIPPLDVKFGEQGAPTKVVNSLGNEWGVVAIFLSPLVDRSIVLYWA
jgi:hypothetical protein